MWRIEIRAGKDELDNWNIKTFANLEEKAASLIVATLEAIRYTMPTNDLEASRWPDHPLWSIAHEVAADVLAPYATAATRGKVIEGLRAAALNHFRSLLPGLIASYGYLRGYHSNDLPAVLDQVAILVRDYAARNPKAMAEKFRRAAERYALLQ